MDVWSVFTGEENERYGIELMRMESIGVATVSASTFRRVRALTIRVRIMVSVRVLASSVHELSMYEVGARTVVEPYR